MVRVRVLGLFHLMLVSFLACAQPPVDTERPRIQSAEAPAEPDALPLYPAGAPRVEGGKPTENWTSYGDTLSVRNVTSPSITPFLPDPEKATGAAVVVAPGGAFMLLSVDHEGWAVARWLAERGIAAFVLKYRLHPTPSDDDAFLQAMQERMSSVGKREDPPPAFQPAVADGIAAVRYVRRNAAKWKVDPQRVGMIGFSAGAMTTLQTMLMSEPDERPDFIGLIYGPMHRVAVPEQAPPLFAAIASDDRIFSGASFGIVESWITAGRPVEFHLYQQGGHGFGMQEIEATASLWPEQFYAWMKFNNLLE